MWMKITLSQCCLSSAKTSQITQARGTLATTATWVRFFLVSMTTNVSWSMSPSVLLRPVPLCTFPMVSYLWWMIWCNLWHLYICKPSKGFPPPPLLSTRDHCNLVWGLQQNILTLDLWCLTSPGCWKQIYLWLQRTLMELVLSAFTYAFDRAVNTEVTSCCRVKPLRYLHGKHPRYIIKKQPVRQPRCIGWQVSVTKEG